MREWFQTHAAFISYCSDINYKRCLRYCDFLTATSPLGDGNYRNGAGFGCCFLPLTTSEVNLNSFLYDAASRNQVYFGHILLINEYFSITYSSPGACFSFLKQIAHQRLHQSCRCVKEPRMQFGIRLSHSKRCFKNISLHLIIFPLFQGEPIIHNINTFT